MKVESFDVAWTRKCAECSSNKEMRWLALEPSLLTAPLELRYLPNKSLTVLGLYISQ